MVEHPARRGGFSGWLRRLGSPSGEEGNELRGLIGGATRRLDELASALAEVQLEFGVAVQRLQETADRLGGQIEGLEAGVVNLERHHQRLELHTRVSSTLAWLEHMAVPDDVKVTVILPTRNRVDLLRRAIASVESQRYERWELVIVDDGSMDGTDDLLASLDDPRIVRVRTEGVGVAAARNRGLDVATGDVVAYLDDDNLLHPQWVKALAWIFGRSTVEFVYGARVVEHPADLGISGEGAVLHFEPFARDRLEQGNYIDVGVVAHRQGLEEARFDERLSSLADWDLILRLTEHRPALPLPVIAVFYSTSAPDRLTDRPEKAREAEAIRRRLLDDRKHEGSVGDD